MQNTSQNLTFLSDCAAFDGALRHADSAYISAGWRSLEAYQDIFIHERILGVKVLGGFRYSGVRDCHFSNNRKKRRRQRVTKMTL